MLTWTNENGKNWIWKKNKKTAKNRFICRSFSTGGITKPLDVLAYCFVEISLSEYFSNLKSNVTTHFGQSSEVCNKNQTKPNQIELSRSERIWASNCNCENRWWAVRCVWLYDSICSIKFNFQLRWLFAHSVSALSGWVSEWVSVSVCEWIYYYVYILDTHRISVAIFFSLLFFLGLSAGEMVRAAFYCMFWFFSPALTYTAMLPLSAQFLFNG